MRNILFYLFNNHKNIKTYQIKKNENKKNNSISHDLDNWFINSC